VPVLVQGWQTGGDRRVRVPLLVACQQARPLVRDLETPGVPRPALWP